MNRNIASTLAVVATALFVTQRGAAPPYEVASAGASPPTISRSAPMNTVAAAGPCATDADCAALVPYADRGPWVASCAWFGTYGVPPPRAQSIRLDSGAADPLGQDLRNWCLPSGKASPALAFIIVMAPDPLTTHLALYFDRTVDSVTAAAEQSNFYLDRYWLPWSVPGAGANVADTSKDVRVNEILEKFKLQQPGVLVLSSQSVQSPCSPSGRPYCLLYTFLVGESPTSGVNRAQFENAVSYARVLSGDAAPVIHVVGPFFSGSTPSVLALTQDWSQARAQLGFISGTMTSKELSRTLRTGLAGRGIGFSQTLHNDSEAQQLLLQFLQDRQLTRHGENVAILKEDETRYGSVTDPSSDPRTESAAVRSMPGVFRAVTNIRFPREIARLRNASADTFGAPAIAPGSATMLPPEGLTWHWKDATSDQDSVPAFSGQQAPLSQQAVMSSIADVIRRKDIKYVGIIATDIFDILFVSRFVKLAAPNIRIFVLDADALMVQTTAEGRELDGTLAITTYPLFSGSQEWSRPKGAPRALEAFPSRVAEGVYNAALMQLAPTNQVPPLEYVNALDEGPTFRPPLWVTMVGRNGFWPVAAQDIAAAADQRAPGSWPPGVQSHPLKAPVRARLKFDPPDGTTVLLEGGLLFWGVVHLLGMHLASWSKHRWLRQFQIRDPASRLPYAHHQLYYLLCSTLSLSAMLLLVGLTFLELSWKGTIAYSRSPWLFELLYGLIIATGAALLYMACRVARKIDPETVSWGFQGPPWFIACVVLGVWVWKMAVPGSDGIFFAQRAFDWSNGVSPLLPVETLLLMYYAWGWFFIRKARFAENKQVQVPEPALLGVTGDGLEGALQELEDSTGGLTMCPRLTPWIVCAFCVVFVLFRPWEALRSVEGAAYDALIVVLVAFICLLIVVAWARYLFVWSRLRRILRGLERTPLRRAFSRLPKSYSWSQLWYEGVQRRDYLISARSLECYEGLVAASGQNVANHAHVAKMTAAFQSVVNPTSRADTDMAQGEAVRVWQGMLLMTARQLLRGNLTNRWMLEGGSDSLDGKPETVGADDTSSSDGRLKLLAEEFVALRYVSLILYESVQMKNLVVLMGVGFVLAVASLGAYPFLASGEGVWTLGAVFVIFGAAVIASFAQMDRDAIMSRMSGTDPGSLDWNFVLRVLSYGGLPLLALLASQFPSVGRSMFAWLEPALNALH